MEETKNTQNQNMLSVPVAIVIAGALIGGAVFLSSRYTPPKTNTISDQNQQVQPEAQQPQQISVDTNGWEVLGNTNAPVTIVEYADYVCPFCHRFFTDTFPQLKKDYIDTGKVKFIYKDFAVVGGEKAAEASHCAQDQGKFWQYHDLLFSSQTTEQEDVTKWQDPKTHQGYAQQLGLDVKKLLDCFNSGKYTALVGQSTQEAINNGGQGTPYFLVNKTALSGAQPYSVFQTTIDSMLK